MSLQSGFSQFGQIQVKAWEGKNMEANTAANDDGEENFEVDIRFVFSFDNCFNTQEPTKHGQTGGTAGNSMGRGGGTAGNSMATLLTLIGADTLVTMQLIRLIFTEMKIVPGLVVVFCVVYWTIGILLYSDVFRT